MKFKFLTKFVLVIISSIWLQPSTALAADKLLIAGGLNASAQTNLFTISTNSGKTWQIKLLPGVNNSASLGASDCTGEDGAASCLVSVKNHLASMQQKFSNLYYSSDNGSRWAHISLTLPWPKNIAYDLTINKVSCTGKGDDVICFAAGYSITLSSAQNLLPSPMIIATSNGGKQWAMKNIPELPSKGQFNGCSCTGSGAKSICVAVGNSADEMPIIAVSNDGGKTLALKNITDITDKLVLSAVSCTGSGANAVCTIIGQKVEGLFESLIISSTDGGNTWNSTSVDEANVSLKSVSCSGAAPTSICVVAGTANKAPLLMTTNDNGVSWLKKSIVEIDNSNYGNIRSVSCAGDSKTGTCVALGSIGGFYSPLVAVSTDGAKTWQQQAVLSDLRYTEGSGVNCAGKDTAITCMVWGANLSKDYWLTPVIAISDNGINWKTAVLPGITRGVLESGVVSKY